jgi:hypothetical protein
MAHACHPEAGYMDEETGKLYYFNKYLKDQTYIRIESKG